MINGDATFVAPATPYGHSGLAVVRINGPKSLETLSKLAPNAKLKDRSAVLSKIRTSSGELIDECVVTFFNCLLYTSPSPRDQRGSRMPSSA